MMRREDEERLIAGADERNERSSKKRVFVLCCICILIVLLLVALAMFLSKKHTPGSHGKNNASGNDSFKNYGLSQSLNGNNSNNSDNTISSHVYIVNVKPNLTEGEACSIESILRLLPDKTIFLIDFNKQSNHTYNKSCTPPDYLGLLVHLYKDRLQVVSADKDKYFRDTPLEKILKSEDKFEFLAMLVTSYRYGGFVAAPRIIMNNRDLVECLPEETVVEPYVILSSKGHDEFLSYLMESFSVCGPKMNISLDEMLTKSVELFNKPGNFGMYARRLTAHEVCIKPDRFCSFVKVKEAKDREPQWVCEFSSFCKQVVQALLGIRINQLEVDEETSKIRSHLAKKAKTCKPPTQTTPVNGTS